MTSHGKLLYATVTMLLMIVIVKTYWRISQLESQISLLLCDWGGSCPVMCDVCCSLPYNTRTGEMMVHHLHTERGLWNEEERFVNLELSKDSMVMYVGANTEGRDGKILMDMFGRSVLTSIYNGLEEVSRRKRESEMVHRHMS